MFSADTAVLGKRPRACDPGQPRGAIVPVMEGTVRGEIWASVAGFPVRGKQEKNNPRPRRKVKSLFNTIYIFAYL